MAGIISSSRIYMFTPRNPVALSRGLGSTARRSSEKESDTSPGAAQAVAEGSPGAGRSTDKPHRKSPQSPLLADMSRKRIIDRMLRVDHAGERGARQWQVELTAAAIADALRTAGE